MRTSIIRTVTLPSSTPAPELTGPSPRRVGLLFLPATNVRYTVSTEPGATIDQGLTLQVAGELLELTLERHGEIVRRAWYGIAASSATISFLETFEEGA